MIVEKRGYVKTYDDEGKLVSKVRVGSSVELTVDEEDELDFVSDEYGDESA